ncbi:DUF1102 domain-containing protein [Haloplanus pelagicus]|jgi:hypothetical protein|uniref:DUF1102 domain-containing protein n=1 Tax=Haloplanus pelagicus TaxID=2949995 RepID=UPI00203A8338|nr:DUF1102 domain-containing protein [Haloplanus sp. HW8-1]
MKRRNLLLGIGGLSAAGAGMRTGAFSLGTVDRSADVTVANEDDAYLAMAPSSGPNGAYATQGSNKNELALDFTNNGQGGGVNSEGEFYFDNVLTVENRATQTVYVWARFGGGSQFDNQNLYLYPNGARDTKLNDQSNSVLTLAPGERANIGAYIDTSSTSTGSSETLTMTVRADVDNPSGTNSVGPSGGQALVVSQDPDQNEYGSIQNAIDDATGTDVLVEAGTYNEAIVIDKDDITLRSLAGAGQTTIRASTEDANVDFGTGSNKAVLVDGATDVTIDGFTVTFESAPANNSEKYAVRGRPDGSGGGPDNLVVANNIIEDFSTSDQPGNSGAVRAGGVSIDMNPTGGLGPATTNGIEVRNNIIRDIECVGDVDQNDSRAKGIAMNGDVQEAVIMDNTIHNIGTTSNEDPNAAEELANTSGVEGTEKPRGISLTENGPTGPTNFEIVRNDFDGIEGTYGQPAIFVGGSNGLGGSHAVRFNNFRHPVDNLSGEALVLRKNWWSSGSPPATSSADSDADGGVLIDRGPGAYDQNNSRSSQVNDAGSDL